MPKPNKYLYLHVVQGYYGPYHGWEDLCQSESAVTAYDDLVIYNREEPDYPHRLIGRRELNPEWEAQHAE